MDSFEKLSRGIGMIFQTKVLLGCILAGIIGLSGYISHQTGDTLNERVDARIDRKFKSLVKENLETIEMTVRSLKTTQEAMDVALTSHNMEVKRILGQILDTELRDIGATYERLADKSYVPSVEFTYAVRTCYMDKNDKLTREKLQRLMEHCESILKRVERNGTTRPVKKKGR